MSEKTLKPSIRFKGFTEDWEQCKVTELGKVFIGLVTTMTKHYTDSGYLLIRNSDIKDNHFDFDENPIYLEKSFGESNSSRMHQIGDVITVHTGDVGTSAVISEKEAKSIGFATIVTRPKLEIVNPNYLSCFFNTEKHKLWAIGISTGDGRTNYNLGDFVKLTVPVPQIEEQKKISELIINLNNLITLHQRKYDKLLNIKKSLLEKMFPQNGELIPQIRFKGFTEDWEQHKLGNIGTTYTGLSGKSKDDFGHGQGRYVTYMNVFKNPIADETMTELIEIDSSQREVKYGDVFFTTSSETPEEVGMSSIWLYNSQNTYLNSFCFGYRLDNDTKINPYFLGYLLRSSEPRKALELLAQGISRFNISKTKVMDIEITIPRLNEEQYKIGHLMLSIDNLITLHQRKLEKLKNIKKSLLEKMFV